MPDITFRTTLPVPPSVAFAWHARPGALQRLLPPWTRITVLEQTPAPGATSVINNGGRVAFRIAGVPWTWIATHRDYRQNQAFTDVQTSGPFKSWTHVHGFSPQENNKCELTDHLTYTHGLATSLLRGTVARELTRQFAFRHQRTSWDLRRHAEANLPSSTIAITGASGLVGSALVPFLTTGGHAVRSIGRGQADIVWNPTAGQLDPNAFNGVDAVVHLAGESVAQRWTPAAKERIRSSRINSTALLARTLAGLAKPPRTLIMASGIGYAETGIKDNLCDESAPLGQDFLAQVCAEWEAAAEPARQAGIRVVHLRIGMVISSAGGALAKMLFPFRMGVGGRVGSGQQWQSWIHRDDLVDVIHRALSDSSLSGVINAVAPAAIRQHEFATILGRAVHRPAIAPLPAFAVRLLFGEMGQSLLLGGARVHPARLLSCGHQWRYPTLSEALTFEV
jgi:uncharacterized protein